MLSADRLRRLGIRGAWRSLRSYARSCWRVDDFDRQHGTDTAAIVPLWRFPTNLPALGFAMRYQPVDEDWVIEPLRELRRDWTDFVFLDIGAGKGKAIITAAPFGFKHLIGVEFVPGLAKVAESNLARAGVKNATIVCLDATDYHFPAGNLVVFFYNPFAAEVMRMVIANLRRDKRGKVYVIYAGPEQSGVIHDNRFLKIALIKPNVMVWESEERDAVPS